MKLPEFKDLPKRNQEALKNPKNMTNLEKACYLLGWQGGTIHQVAEATGLSVDQILKADDIETLMKTQMKKASIVAQLDEIASELEKNSPIIALAIDKVSDRLMLSAEEHKLDEAKKKEIINHWKRAMHKDAKFTVESIPKEKDGDLKITIEFPEPLIEEDHGDGHSGGRITEALGFAGIPGRIKEVYVHKIVAWDNLSNYYPNKKDEIE